MRQILLSPMFCSRTTCITNTESLLTKTSLDFELFEKRSDCWSLSSVEEKGKDTMVGHWKYFSLPQEGTGYREFKKENYPAHYGFLQLHQIVENTDNWRLG